MRCCRLLDQFSNPIHSAVNRTKRENAIVYQEACFVGGTVRLHTIYSGKRGGGHGRRVVNHLFFFFCFCGSCSCCDATSCITTPNRGNGRLRKCHWRVDWDLGRNLIEFTIILLIIFSCASSETQKAWRNEGMPNTTTIDLHRSIPVFHHPLSSEWIKFWFWFRCSSCGTFIFFVFLLITVLGED